MNIGGILPAGSLDTDAGRGPARALAAGHAATRLPAQDLERASRFHAVDVAGLRTVDGIASVEGNYASSGGVGEWAAWFRDSEGTLIGIGEPIPPNPAPGD